VPRMVAPDFADLADRVVPSVVSVFTTDVVTAEEREKGRPRDPFHFFFRFPGPRDDEPEVRPGAGSGFFITPDGEILTNNHVVEDADEVEIELADGTRYEVKVVGTDPATDIALLRVKKADRTFPVLALGDSDATRVGEWVMAVGNPLNLDHTVTVGVVSAKGRRLGLADTSFENYIQTDAAINFGNSGGPLVNLRGEVVGINTAINVRGENLGFAVPINTAKTVLPQLREHGKVVRGFLGVTVGEVTREVQEAWGLKERRGALVEQVLEGHAADRAGIRHGDVIVAVNGRRVDTTRDLIDTISSYPPGTKVELEVIRDGRKLRIPVTLEERTEEGGEPPAEEEKGGEESVSKRTGLTVTSVTARMRQYYGLDEDVEGAAVVRVRPLSPAAREGLMRGDIVVEANGEPVRSARDFVRAVKAVKKGGYLRLYVYRPRVDRSFFAILKLDD